MRDCVNKRIQCNFHNNDKTVNVLLYIFKTQFKLIRWAMFDNTWWLVFLAIFFSLRKRKRLMLLLHYLLFFSSHNIAIMIVFFQIVQSYILIVKLLIHFYISVTYITGSFISMHFVFSNNHSCFKRWFLSLSYT